MKHKKSLFPKEWKEQIEKSGKLFEQQIARIIQKSNFGWIIPNYAFTDVERGESRELDVFAITAKSLDRRRDKWNFIFPVLLVAIKNMPLVCFTRKEIMSRYTIGDVHFSGMPKNIYSKNEEIELAEYLNFEKYHHFYKYERISSQFWTPLQQKSDQRGEYVYRDLIFPLIKAVVFEKQDHEEGWYFDPEEEPVNLQIYYPVVVVNQLWECDLSRKKPVYKRVSNVGFVSHYASEKVSGDYHIDICDQNGLEKLLVWIETEADKFAGFMQKKLKIFEQSALEDAKRKLEDKQQSNK